MRLSVAIQPTGFQPVVVESALPKISLLGHLDVAVIKRLLQNDVDDFVPGPIAFFGQRLKRDDRLLPESDGKGLVAILASDSGFLTNNDCSFEHNAHLLGYSKWRMGENICLRL